MSEEEQESIEQAKEKGRESFIRWQGHSITQFGNVTNLLLGLAVGELSVLFGVTYKARKIIVPSWMLIASGTILFFSVAIGCSLALVRLYNFRHSKDAANERRKRKDGWEDRKRIASAKADCLGMASWALLWIQTVSFGLGSLLLFIVTGIAIVCRH